MQYRSILPVFALLTCSLGAAACGTGSTQLVGPTGPKCQASVSGVPTTLPAEGGEVRVSVTAARECGWTATSEASWAVVTPSSGQGAASLTIRVSPNAAAAPRSGSLMVNDARIGLRQEPAPCRYALSSSSAEVPSSGGPVAVGIAAPSGCAWTASGGAWVHVVRGSGSGHGTAEFQAAPNAGAARSIVLTVAGLPWRIDQPAASAPGEPGPAPTPTPTPTPEPPPQVTLLGRASNVAGSCPDLRFTLEGRSVYTDSATEFRSGNCKHIDERRELRVEGEIRDGGVVYARVVEIRGRY